LSKLPLVEIESENYWKTKFHHKCSSKWQRNQCIDRLNGKLSKFVRKYNLKAHWKLWVNYPKFKFILDDTSNFPPLVPIQEVSRTYFVSRYFIETFILI
jgi:hypothetical protein